MISPISGISIYHKYRISLNVWWGQGETGSPALPGFGVLVYCLLIAYCIGAVLAIAIITSKTFKVKLKPKEILFTALFATLFFLPCFYFSSLLLRGREDGRTIYRYGYPQPYEGAFLFYGFPAVMYRMFEPYDTSVPNPFSGSISFYFYGFFINFAFWIAPPIILAYAAKRFRSRRRK